MSRLKLSTVQCPKSLEVRYRTGILIPAGQKDNAPQAATGEAFKTVTQTSQERENRMKSTMPPHGRQSAVVLLHPNHAGTPVVNPVLRGRKPGVISFRGAAMRLWLSGRPTPLLDGSSPAIQQVPPLTISNPLALPSRAAG